MSKMPEMMKKEMMKEMSKKMNEYGSMNIVAMKEYTGGSPGMSVSSNTVKTALKNLSKGQALHVSGKPQRGLRTMGRVISISGDTVKIKPTASNGPTSANVKDITSMDVMKEELDEAAFSQTQIDALKQKYSGLRGSEKNGIQMDKLAKIMKRYPKDHLNQLAKLDIPMVSKVAKAMTEETFNENWQYEMEIEYGDSMDDDQETIVVFGNVRGATLESQADRKYEQLEKQMQKKYGRDAMIDGGTMKGKTNDRSRGGSNPIERKDI